VKWRWNKSKFYRAALNKDGSKALLKRSKNCEGIMKTFDVMLTRAYKVTIDAEDEKFARELAEFFIGDPKDESTEREQAQYKFNIREIEITMNEAMEAGKTE
jgi:hypothetical protein